MAPVATAGRLAADAEVSVCDERFVGAVDLLTAALERVPYDGDHAFRAAQASFWAGRDGRPMLDRALAANPLGLRYLLFRAQAHGSYPPVDVPAAIRDFERALSLDPQNVPARRDFADLLRRVGRRDAARAQYERTLAVNDQLPPDEQERLSPEKVEEIRRAIAELGDGGGGGGGSL